MTSEGGSARGHRFGAELRSCSPATPSSRNLASHLYTVAGDTEAALATSPTDQPSMRTRSTSTLRPYGVSFALRWATRASFRSGVGSTPNRDGRLSSPQQPWWELQLAEHGAHELISRERVHTRAFEESA